MAQDDPARLRQAIEAAKADGNQSAVERLEQRLKTAEGTQAPENYVPGALTESIESQSDPIASGQPPLEEQRADSAPAEQSKYRTPSFGERLAMSPVGVGGGIPTQAPALIEKETGVPINERETLADRAATAKATGGALASGALNRLVGNPLANKDEKIEELNSFQRLIYDKLPEPEQARVMGAIKEKYGENHKYTKDVGKVPASVMRDILEQNPENEKLLDEAAGKEFREGRRQNWNKLGAYYLLGSADPRTPGAMGALAEAQSITRKGLEDIEYKKEEDKPWFPGAANLAQEWESEADAGISPYEHFIKPLVQKTTGEMPGKRVQDMAEGIINATFNEEQLKERKYPLVSPDIEIKSPLDLFNLDVWTHPETKLPHTNFEAWWLMLMESMPEMTVSILGTRGAGRLAAARAARDRAGQTLASIEKARNRAAMGAGLGVGTGIEGYYISQGVQQEATNVLKEVPISKYRENPHFQAIVDAGVTPEDARQLMAVEAGSAAGQASWLGTVALGGPMSAAIGRSGAGSLARNTLGKTRLGRGTLGALGEGFTEGFQEVHEQYSSDIAVRKIDPDNPIFKEPNRYANLFAGGFTMGAAMGSAAIMESDSPAGYEAADVAVASATEKWMTATNKRFAFELKITDPEYINRTSPIRRLEALEKLESLQEAETKALLDAEPIMRQHLEKQGTETAQTEIKMLNRLKMRANAMKTDIAVARSKRTTARNLQDVEESILRERAELQDRVEKRALQLEDLESMAQAIETVQNQGAISQDQERELVREGYAKRTEEGRLVIRPKGRRALKELMRQARALRSSLESGFTGNERRQNENIVKRQLIDELGPAEREKQLYSDPMTEVQNRRAFNERQEHIDVKAGEKQRTIEGAAPAVAAVDVDSLKWVNDNMTHAAGDRLLVAVADALNKQPGVEVYRMGGDEFAVTGQSEEQLENALQAAAKELLQTPIVAANDEVTPQITWGKGKTYSEADLQGVQMKQDRVARGVTSNREGKPATYRVRSQGGLFSVDMKTTKQGKQVVDESANDIIDRARAGDPDAQATLKRFGLRWDGNKTKYRKTGKAEVDRLLAGETIRSTRNKKTITDITDNPEYGDVRQDSDHRITFKQTDKFDTDREGSPTRLKNEKKGEYHLHDGYSLNDVQKIEQRQEDGTWKEIYASEDEAPEAGTFDYEGEGLPGSWRQISDSIKKGDIVEILTPDGATFGLVRAISRNRSRPRLYVAVQGKIFKFNPEQNWLIVDKFTDPADLAWITGDAEYAQPGRDTFPQTLADVTIGHIGDSEGNWYADLDQEYQYTVPLPWYMEERWTPRQVDNTPKLEPASQEDYMRAVLAVEAYKRSFPNHPDVNIVRDLVQLEKDAPDVVAQMKAELGGGSLRGVRGYMDHINPQNGIYIFVQNLDKYNFEQEVTEVVVHEMVGHYGVRGFFGDELALREQMSDLVDAFPRLAKYYAGRLTSAAGVGLDPKIPEHKQLIGEEMVAYIAGEVESGKLKMTDKQKSVWRRIIDFFKGLLKRRGFLRISPIENAKREFWNDSRVQQMLQRSQEFLRSEKDFKWRAAGGSKVFMRNAEMFRLQIKSAVESATKKLSQGERKRRAKQMDVPLETIPEEEPLFPERGNANQWQEAFTLATKSVKDGGLGISKLEMELTGMDKDAEWSFFRDVTYGDLEGLHTTHINNGNHDTFWYRGVLPSSLSQELDDIYTAMDKMYVSGPMPRYADETNRPVLNAPSIEAMKSRINEIRSMKINPKQTQITKDLVRAHLNSDNTFDVYVEFYGAERPTLSYSEAVTRVFGNLDQSEISSLTQDQIDQIKQEQRLARERGYNIGYDEKLDRWFDYYGGSATYREYSPQGAKMNDFRIVLIKTKGRNGEMTSTNQHFGPNIIHLRTGLAELLEGVNLEGVEFPNPAMAGKMLSLIEIQSDHFQALRKAFSNVTEKDQAERNFEGIRNTLSLLANKFSGQLAEDLNSGFENLLLPVANMPDGKNMGAEVDESIQATGSLARNLDKRAHNEFQKPWNQLTGTQKDEVWEAEKVAQLNEVDRKLLLIKDKLMEYLNNEIYPAKQLLGTLDARAYKRLDAILTESVVSSIINDISTARDTLIYLRDSRDQRQLVQRLNGRSRMNETSHALRAVGTRQLPQLRLTQAKYMLEMPLNEMYELLTGGTEGVSDLFSLIENIHTTTIQIPVSTFENYQRASLRPITDESLNDLAARIFSRTNMADAGLIRDNIRIQPSVVGEYVTVQVEGDKETLESLQEKLPYLVEHFIQNHGSQSRISELNSRLRSARSNRQNLRHDGYDYDFLSDYLDLEEAETSGDGDALTRQYDIQTFYQFEENDGGETESEILNEAFYNVDWEAVENGELSRNSEEYRSRLVIEDDGSVDNTDAEEWLEQERDTYKYETLREEIMDEVSEALWQQWNESPSALIVGRLPSAWDFDGNVEDTVEVMIIAKEHNDAYDIYIDGSEVDYHDSLDGARSSLDDAISNWYTDENIDPPAGQPYGRIESNDEVTSSLAELERIRDSASPNWDLIASTISEAAVFRGGELKPTASMFNEMVMIQKKLAGYEIMPSHPLSKDELWRPIALKYLIADAVRRGLGGIMWNQGLASAARGGLVRQYSNLADSADVTRVERFSWVKQKTTLRNPDGTHSEQEVFVISSPDLERPLVVARSQMIPILGIDATRQINMQDAGKIPVPSLPAAKSQLPAIDPDAQYIFSTTENTIGGDVVRVTAVYRRADNEFIGFAANDEAIQNLINQDQRHYGRYTREQDEASQDVEPEAATIDGEVLSSGLVRSQDTGDSLYIVHGTMPSSYAHTYAIPKLGGARQSYEDILVRTWNKELKKYGTYIQETYVKVEDSNEAYNREGQPALVDAEGRDALLEQEHGQIAIKELTGAHHGWMILSEKQGPINQEVFNSRDAAKQALDSFIDQNYPIDKRGVKVFYIPITPEMREEFSGPVAPFAYDPEKDPALKEFISNIGHNKKSVVARFADWKVGWKDRQKQGMLDMFWGLRKALLDAEVGDDPYMDARLSTSLDSIMKGLIEYGHPVWKDGVVQNEGMSMSEVFAPIMNDPDTWSYHMVGLRAKDLLMEGWANLQQSTDAKDVDRVSMVKALLPMFPGETEAEQIWNMLVAWDRGEMDQRVGLEGFGTVRYRSFTKDELAGLSEKEKQYLMHILNTKHWRKSQKTKVKVKDEEGNVVKTKTAATEDAEFGRRWYIFDWRKVSQKDAPRGKWDKKWYPGQKQKTVDNKWQFTIDEMVNEYGFSREEAVESANKLTELALKKQAQHDAAANRVLSKATGSLSKLVDDFSLRITEKGREKTFKPAGIEAAIRLGDKYPQFEQVKNDWAKFNSRVLDFLVASDMMTPELKAVLDQGVYVPFFRIEDDRVVGVFNPSNGIANQRSPMMRLRGKKDAPIGDVFMNIMAQTTKMMDAAVKNNAARNAVDALLGSGMITRVGKDWKPKPITANQLTKVFEDAGINPKNVPKETFEGFRTMFVQESPVGRPGFFSIMRNGKPEYYYTDNQLLWRSLTAINMVSLNKLMPMIPLLTGPKRLYTDWITIDPGFVLRNVIRDTGNAFVISRDWVVPIGGAINGFIEAVTGSETIKRLTGAGAAFESGYLNADDPNATKRLLRRVGKKQDIATTVLDSPFKLYRAWRHITSASENANRIGIYHAAKRAGKSEKRAIFEAKDSMDFSMGGDYTTMRVLKATVPFLNARLQGGYRLAKAAYENPVAFATKGMVIGLAGWLLYMQFRDDERYKELEMWDKHAYFHFWIGADHYRLPKPFEVGAIFNTIPEMFTEAYLSEASDEEVQLAKAFAHILLETFSFTPVPQTLMPLLELGFNYDTFRHRPIVSFYEQQRMPPEQYSYRTSPTMIELARIMPKGLDAIGMGKLRSPKQLEQLWGNYTGTLGGYFLMAADAMVRSYADYPLPPAKEWRDVPILGGFYRGDNPARRTKYEEEVYRMLNKVTDIQGSMRFLETTRQFDRYMEMNRDEIEYIQIAGPLESIRENIQDLNRTIMQVEISPLPDEVDTPEEIEAFRQKKTEQIDKLEEARNRMFKAAYELRPGGIYNPKDDAPQATTEQVLDLIENFGIDDSKAYQMRIEEQVPTTAELLQWIDEGMSKANLESLAKAGGSR